MSYTTQSVLNWYDEIIEMPPFQPVFRRESTSFPSDSKPPFKIDLNYWSCGDYPPKCPTARYSSELPQHDWPSMTRHGDHVLHSKTKQ